MNFNNNGDWLNGGPFEHLKDLTNMNEKMRNAFGPQFLQNIIKQMPMDELNMLKSRLPNWESLFGVNPDATTASTGTAAKTLTYPLIDIYQTRQEVVAVVELPGLASANEVNLHVTATTLSVSGSLEGRFALFKEDRFDQDERFRGPFDRSLDLPVRVKPQQTRARYHNGLLEVRMVKDARQTRGKGGRNVPISF